VTSIDRTDWVVGIRRRNAEAQNALLETTDYDANWGEIEDLHRRFVDRFLSALPPEARVLDAACGTGKYFGMVRATGRSVIGVDHSAAMLERARRKFPDVPTERLNLQELNYRSEFDGVMCMDAMESLPPEDWPVVFDRFRVALHPIGWLYFTVELGEGHQTRAVNEEWRRSGLPVVEGEWAESDGYYHYYPSMEQVRGWVADAGFTIVEEEEGPWHPEGYAYHHVLARTGAGPG
jgi:cyclopropane fatty-acyl-phospholipid synthase-like methyltransferase